MNKFIESELGTLLDTIIDYRGKTPKKLKGEWASSGMPALSAKNIKKGKIVNQEAIRYVDKDLYSRWMKEEVKKGDILMTSEAPLGETFYVKNDDKLLLSQRLFAIRTKKEKLDSQFLYYYFNSKFGNHELLSRATGTTVGGIRQTALVKVLVRYPENVSTQKNISSILSAYDDLIENNEKRIKALEEMAQLLYTEWFAKFKFPGHEKVKLIDSGTEYGKIPEGWEVVKIADRFVIVLGGTPSRAKPEFWENGVVPWINSGEVNNLRITEASELITEKALEKSAAKMMPKRTTVLAITGATLGQVSLTEIECCANQSVIGVFDEDRLLNEYIYLRIKYEIKSIIALAGGGAQQHINKEIVNNKAFLLPDKKTSENFSELIKPIFDEISKLIFNNHNLSKTRDLLIPQLVTGKRELKNI